MHAPLFAVGVINRFAHRIVRHDVENQILCAVVDELVGFVRFEEKRITRPDGCRSVLVPRLTRPGDDVIELPLLAVQITLPGSKLRGISPDG